MSDIPSHLKYTSEHLWLEITGNTATLGLTDYAQEQLGEILHIELPDAGMNVTESDDMASVESIKTNTEVFAPLSGTITDVNHELDETPTLLNEQPYTDGWIAQLEISDVKELEELLSDQDYADYLDSLDE